jgi:hypothetical protein
VNSILIDYSLSVFAKPTKKVKQSKPLRGRKKLKSHYEPVPLEVKLAALELKGRFCLAGHCPNCGGKAEVNEHDDPHHFPRRSKQGKNIVEHVWMARRECHSFLHDNPLIERMAFKEIEAAGIPVVWKVKQKSNRKLIK